MELYFLIYLLLFRYDFNEARPSIETSINQLLIEKYGTTVATSEQYSGTSTQQIEVKNQVSLSTAKPSILLAIVGSQDSNTIFQKPINCSVLSSELSIDISDETLYKSYRPSFAGSGATIPPRVKPGKPWPARPEDYIGFSVTTNRNPQIVDRFKETTTFIQNLNRPPFAGLGTTSPPKVKPGKPWPSRPQDYGDFSAATNNSPQIADKFKETTTEKLGEQKPEIINQNVFENNSTLNLSLPSRPSFTGSAITHPPKVEPEKHWPSKPQDYAEFSATSSIRPQIIDRFKETTTAKQSIAFINENLNNNTFSNTVINLSNANRPPFAGSATTQPPRVQPGKPWPARPQDYADFSVTSSINPQIVDRFKETTTEKQTAESIHQNLNNSTYSNIVINLSNPNRPPFAGSATPQPPRVKPGKPWPSRPQDYADFSVTSSIHPQIVDRFTETTTEKPSTAFINQNLNNITISNTVINLSNANRPPFAGSATTQPPRVQPGKPWPARPQDYADFSVTSSMNPQIVDRFKETTTEKQSAESIHQNLNNSTYSNIVINLSNPNRPPFAGSATTQPPRVKPGKPWPSRPQDYADFSVTSSIHPQIVDRFKETTTEKPSTAFINQNLNNSTFSNTVINLSKPNRPPFAGSATTQPPRVKPGKPWPARPQDYADFSVTSSIHPQIVDRFKETTTEKPSTAFINQNLNNSTFSNTVINLSNPNRPPFAGSATMQPPRVKPGKPWLSRPQVYADFNVTSSIHPQTVDRMKETTTENQSPAIVNQTLLITNLT